MGQIHQIARFAVSTKLLSAVLLTMAAAPIAQGELQYYRDAHGRSFAVDMDDPASPYRVPPAGPTKQLKQTDITFNVTYNDVIDNTNIGFDDPVDGPLFRSVVDDVLEYIDSVLDESGAVDIVFEESEDNGNSGLLASAGLPTLLASRPEMAGLEGLGDALPGPGLAALFLVFFLGGYFIFSGLYAAVGAMCSSEQEAQQAQTPLVLLLVIPVVILVGVMQAPNSPVSVALSLGPFFSPFLMFARAGMGAAPAWQIALSVVLMAVTVVAVAWVAGRIYRVGILMAGKRPTLPELWRWVRQA